MKRKSFTLIEILVALIILSILASVSVAFYQKTVDTNNERICAENLKVLQAAIDIYTVENDALPAALAQLTPRYIYLAYSRVIGEKKEGFLSIALRKMFSTEPALADSFDDDINSPILFVRKYINGKRKLFKDPAASIPGTLGGCTINTAIFPSSVTCGSYIFDFNINTFNNTTKKLITGNSFVLIYDPSDRHKGRFGTTPYSIGVTAGGRTGKINLTSKYITDFH